MPKESPKKKNGDAPDDEPERTSKPERLFASHSLLEREKGRGDTRDFPAYRIMKVEALIPYIRNARTHTDAQIAQIAASIREFGFTNPILIDSERGVVAGHGRLLAARKLGMVEVPVVELAHLTPAQKRAYALADNRLALSAGWDEEMLRIEIEDLKSIGVDLALTGFENMEIDQLFAEPTDVSKEWQGMPEFDMENKIAFRSIIIHFKDQDAVDEFSRLIDQNITTKMRSLWHPRLETEKLVDKHYSPGEP
jgi:ParB-like chromosome segregation protein Spo0J